MNLQVDYQRVEVVADCFASSAFGLGHQRPCHFDHQGVRNLQGHQYIEVGKEGAWIQSRKIAVAAVVAGR